MSDWHAPQNQVQSSGRRVAEMVDIMTMSEGSRPLDSMGALFHFCASLWFGGLTVCRTEVGLNPKLT